MEFEQWVVSPASALTDPDFDLTASETSFHMPAQDITLTAQYRPSIPTIDDAPVDPAISTAVTIIGGALLVGGLHQLGTELWLIHHLPKGTAIPETRSTGRSALEGCRDSLLLLPKPLIPISTPTTPMRSRLHSGQLKTS